MTIRNPIEWGWDQFRHAADAVSIAGRSLEHTEETLHSPLPAIRRIGLADLREVLAQGLDDFAAYRTDVVFLCLVYPIVGLVLARFAFGQGLLPLIFPLASGFALIGPFAAVGLYEMSRKREQGERTDWSEAFAVVREPSFGTIAFMGLLLIAVYLLWLIAAETIYYVTLGPVPPLSLGAFIRDLFNTAQGWTLIAVGLGVGFLFAFLVLVTNIVSFPLLLDRDAGIDTAIRTSFRAFAVNPGPILAWGLMVALALVLGSIPVFVGLIVVMPVLGHATWHLYRRLIAP